ncbi:rod shape-determining protein MreC [Sporolactobacillus inulinus]|uniref:Cell shape-determining protein MreC n=1 Tax=Sporolactobacillus inulinus CASD TaxID=1069536 RepID=A0A0U1QRD3_9BACL|nr:rod shape-determining protein MreC [Sporolactobacillus inulinus]KLI03377.1 rod shape-determining protein MreC [Sporolactobacillus inulinus CASD]GEB76368.1 cell shape-determining protein MreC [Sporolactobacillus inulinus]
MPSFFSNKKLIILLTSLIILIALISYSLKQGTRANWAEQFVQDVVGGFQYVINVPARYAAGFFQNVNAIENAYKENKRLKENLANYASVEQENRTLTAQNKTLRAQLGLKNDPKLSDFRKYSAMMIGRTVDQFNQLLTIDKGRVNGIEDGMPVITSGKRLIGSITKASSFTSKVSLISDDQNANQISAVIQPKKGDPIPGMIEGYDQNKDLLYFRKIPIKAKVQKGQVVITSGLSGKYPEGLVIGTVTKVTTDQYGLTKAAQVKPAANLNDLSYVLILERKTSVASDEGD